VNDHGFSTENCIEATATRYRGVDPDEIHVKKKKRQVNKLAPRINYAIGAIQAPIVSQTPGKKKYVPSELEETPYHVCNHLILLFQCW
jgi:hypothetical protein